MSHRKTVQIKLERILNASKAQGWSAATLARRTGKHDRWFSEMKRGKNLPSPEEAARMCLLLNTTPDEILTEPADIELVNGLIAQEREKQGIKKDPVPEGTEGKEKFSVEWFREAMKDVTDQAVMLEALQVVTERLQEIGGGKK